MSKTKGSLFWGYVDNEGRIEVKKYLNDRQIANYERLPMVTGIFDPFPAKDIWEARKMVEERYKQELN
jgi:hypothetical protein